MKLNYLLLFVVAFCIISLSLPVYSSSYSGSLLDTTTYSYVEIDARADLIGGTYTINGNFWLKTGVTLAVQKTSTLNVSGDVTIDGQIIANSSDSCTLTIKSTNGNILISGTGTINLVGSTGTQGANGSLTVSTANGSTGKTTALTLIAEKGNITVNNSITVTGGSGGTGGNGAGSSGSTDGGKGGTGGIGGAGGPVSISAWAGKVIVNSAIKSLGGTGGTGGIGGPDQSIIGGPGAGGNGGDGGIGGSIVITAQDLSFSTTAAFDVSGGKGGVGGAGGSGGTFTNPGPKGSSGKDGTAAGPIKLVAGEAYYGTSSAAPITTFPAMTVTPASTSVVKTFIRDTTVPNAPTVSMPAPSYNSAPGKFYTSKLPLTITVNALDKGVTYAAIDYASGISYFTVTSAEGSANYSLSDAPNPTGNVNLTLDYLQNFNLTRYDVTVTAYDKYGYMASTGPIAIVIDQTAPQAPALKPAVLQPGGLKYDFSWSAASDVSGISGYSVFINGVEKPKQSGLTYTVTGGYNEQIGFYVKASDGVGNVSPASLSQTVVTAPQSTSIKSIDLQKTANGGIVANVNFTSVGSNAAGYRLKYHEVDYLNQPIGPDYYREIGAISTVQGGIYTHSILNLENEKLYNFSICTYNKNSLTPIYSDWIPYSSTVDTTGIANNPATARILTSSEIWEGTVTLTGDITVPQGMTLTLKPGTIVKVPTGNKLTIDGKLVCDGTTAMITFTNTSPLNTARTNVWKGVYLSPNSSGSIIKNVTFENASRGLALNRQNLDISGCIFKNNGIGIQISETTIRVDSCQFDSNTYYGIKEELTGWPTVKNSIFQGNKIGGYYSADGGITADATLNALMGSANQLQ